MAGLWVSAVGGNWIPGDGYEHVMAIFGLEDFVRQLYDQTIFGVGSLDRIAILAHGDRPGQIVFEGKKLVVDSGNYGKYQSHFKNIGNFIKPGGRLIFYSCIAGLGKQGDQILARISRSMPERFVIGFSVIVGLGALDSPAPTQAGRVKNLGGIPSRNLEFQSKQPYANEWIAESKWAWNGMIVKPTNAEVLEIQYKDEKYLRCGSIFCPGHSKMGHRCKVYRRLPGRIVYTQLPKRPSRGTLGLESSSQNRNTRDYKPRTKDLQRAPLGIGVN
jgi:hypothetical protein